MDLAEPGGQASPEGTTHDHPCPGSLPGTLRLLGRVSLQNLLREGARRLTGPPPSSRMKGGDQWPIP
eukprot:2174910-Alexandrium_andersonii.AAC.1